MEVYRRKNREPITYNANGDIESIYYFDQKPVHTSIGDIPAELVTFYENGNVERVFPRYGALSGFWSEEDEYSLAEEMNIRIGKFDLNLKPQCIRFYPEGEVWSITLWRFDEVGIKTPYGTVKTRKGFSFYRDGSLESIEPVFDTRIDTGHGIVRLYDPDAFPLNADNNSLVFNEDGTIRSMKTIG